MGRGCGEGVWEGVVLLQLENLCGEGVWERSGGGEKGEGHLAGAISAHSSAHPHKFTISKKKSDFH